MPKATSIYFERLKRRKEPFENERVGVEIELEDGDTPESAVAYARRFVAQELGDQISVEEAQAALDTLIEAGVDAGTIENLVKDLNERVTRPRLFASLAVKALDRVRS